MNMSSLAASTLSMIASGFTILFIAAVVLYRLLWAASSVTSAAALGRLPKVPGAWRSWMQRWLFGEHEGGSNRRKF